VQKIDDTFILNLSLIEPATVRVVARGSRKVVAAELVDAIQSMVFEVVNQDPLLKGRTVKPERGFDGFTLGVRGDIDFLGFGANAAAVPLAGGIVLGYSPPLVRRRAHPLPEGRLRRAPRAACAPVHGEEPAQAPPRGGLDGFPLGRIGAQRARHQLKVSQLQIFADVGYERFFDFVAGSRYVENSVVAGLGLGWLF